MGREPTEIRDPNRAVGEVHQRATSVAGEMDLHLNETREFPNHGMSQSLALPADPPRGRMTRKQEVGPLGEPQLSMSSLPTTHSQTERQKALRVMALSVHRDDDLADVSACAKVSKGFPRCAQLIRAVDHGDELAGFKTFVQVGQVVVLLQHDQADGFACGLPNAPSENDKLEQSGQVSTDGCVRSPWTERTRVGERGTSRFCIEIRSWRQPFLVKFSFL